MGIRDRVRRGQGILSVNHLMFLLLLVGVVLPWLGLDILFFDEFFLLPVYMMRGAEKTED